MNEIVEKMVECGLIYHDGTSFKVGFLEDVNIDKEVSYLKEYVDDLIRDELWHATIGQE